MASTGRPAEGLTDREILIDTWEIACSLEAAIGELRGKVDDLEAEFRPLARKYQRLTSAPWRQNGSKDHVS